MRQLILLICFSLPATIFAQSNDSKSTQKNSQEVNTIKQLVKNCFSKDLTTREFAANRLMDFPADLFSKKSLKRIKKAVQDDELINFQLILLTGYLQLEDQKARLMEFITIDSSAEYGFNESFSIDSKEWAAHLAMARMENEEYILHTEFVVVHMFYQELFHQELKSSYLMLLEHIAFVLNAGDEWALIDLLEKNEKYYLTSTDNKAEEEQINSLHSFLIHLLSYGMSTNPPLEMRSFNNVEQIIEWFYELSYKIFESQDGLFRCRPRITYPPIYSRLKINIDTTRLLRDGTTYFNKLPNPTDAIRFLEENSNPIMFLTDANAVKAAILLGKIYLKNREADKAIAVFNALLDFSKTNNKPYIGELKTCYMLTDSLLAMHEFDKAHPYIQRLENLIPVYQPIFHNGNLERGINARKLSYFAGKEMVDSVLLLSKHYLVNDFETDKYHPVAQAKIIELIKKNYDKQTIQEMLNDVTIFKKEYQYKSPVLIHYYAKLFGHEFYLNDETLEKQKDLLSKEALLEAYKQYFQNSTFRRLLLE